MEERKKLELRRGYRVRAGEDERVEVGPKVPVQPGSAAAEIQRPNRRPTTDE